MVHRSEPLSFQYILDFPGISHYEVSIVNHTNGVVPDRTLCDADMPKWVVASTICTTK